MKAIGFYFVLPFLYLISILPFFLLYGLSDIIFLLLYYVFAYRRKVVFTNLKNAFPSKSVKEIKQLERKFYRYLCDLILETFKTLTISPKNAVKHCSFSEATISLFNQLNKEEKSCIIVMGHLGNWEWAGSSFSILLKQQLYVIYHPLSNKLFDKMVYKMRTRFGTKLYAMRDTMREMIRNKAEINATAFIADQTPPPEGAYWTTFLNQDTPIFVGPEKIAQKLNFPIVYVFVERRKRAHYLVHAEILVEQPKETEEGFISELHTRRLEKDILNKPETWLWSHRRWKHKRTIS